MIDGRVGGDKKEDISMKEDIGSFQTSVLSSLRTNDMVRAWSGQSVLSGRCQL